MRMWFSPSHQRSRGDTCRTVAHLVQYRAEDEDVVLTLPPEMKVRYLQRAEDEDVAVTLPPEIKVRNLQDRISRGTRDQRTSRAISTTYHELWLKMYSTVCSLFGRNYLAVMNKSLSSLLDNCQIRTNIKHKVT